MEYSDQLKTTEWLNFRNEILKRDKFECQHCKNDRLKQNASVGVIREIRRDRDLLSTLNLNDPRFRPKYIINYIDETGVARKEQIKSHFSYNHEQLKIFTGKKLYISFNQFRINNNRIACIFNYIETGSWFFVNRLEAHHTQYLSNRKAWEYSKDIVQTLCWICHKTEHNFK